MRNAGGYAVLYNENGVHKEADTFTCHHCCTVQHVAPKCDPADLGGLCKSCMKLICPRCANKGTCEPWEEQMRRAEASYHARRSYGF